MHFPPAARGSDFGCGNMEGMSGLRLSRAPACHRPPAHPPARRRPHTWKSQKVGFLGKNEGKSSKMGGIGSRCGSLGSYFVRREPRPPGSLWNASGPPKQPKKHKKCQKWAPLGPPWGGPGGPLLPPVALALWGSTSGAVYTGCPKPLPRPAHLPPLLRHSPSPHTQDCYPALRETDAERSVMQTVPPDRTRVKCTGGAPPQRQRHGGQ